MKPFNDYVVLELDKEEASTFKVTEEQNLCVGIIRTGADELIGKKCLFKRYGFDEYKGQLIGKAENVIALLE